MPKLVETLDNNWKIINYWECEGDFSLLETGDIASWCADHADGATAVEVRLPTRDFRFRGIIAWVGEPRNEELDEENLGALLEQTIDEED